MSDMQIPYQDDYSIAAVEKFMAAHKFHGYLNVGDYIDFDSISSFNFGNPRRTEGRRLSRDFDIANKILDRHQAIIRKNNKHAKFVMLEGNHEERVERFLDMNPSMEGILDIPMLLKFKQRKVKWVKAWSRGETYKVGKLTFTHGQRTTQYHAKAMVQDYGSSVAYGHTHDMMCIPIVHKGKDDILVGQSIGCLCEYDLPYMKGRAHRWQQGFMVVHVMPNGNFTYYTPRIFNHEFVGPDGVLYTP